MKPSVGVDGVATPPPLRRQSIENAKHFRPGVGHFWLMHSTPGGCLGAGRKTTTSFPEAIEIAYGISTMTTTLPNTTPITQVPVDGLSIAAGLRGAGFPSSGVARSWGRQP